MNVFKGVYATRDLVPAYGNAHDELQRERAVFLGTKQALADVEKNKSGDYTNYRGDNEENFHKLVERAFSESDAKLRIVDLGGAMGLHFLGMLATELNRLIDCYYILESPSACKKGAEIFRDYPQLCFVSGFPEAVIPFKADIIYSNSALPYIGEYKKSLDALFSFSADYILFERLYTGDFPTYWTAQFNISNTVFPCQFICEQEFLSYMRNNGYVLLETDIKRFYFSVDDLPQEYRPQGYKSFLFKLQK